MGRHTMVRIHNVERGEVFGLQFGPASLIKDIQEVVAQRTTIPIERQRLIFGGRELNPEKTLEELNVHPKEVLQLLPRHPHVCREWAATGSCSRGRRCFMKATHTVENSPRYVEHHAKPEALSQQPCANQAHAAPAPPLQPRPPSFGKLRAGNRSNQPVGKPPANDAGMGAAQWAQRASRAQQSNSGDWDGLVTDIVNAVEAAEVQSEEEVEEDLDSDERSCEAKSWEESEVAAAFAPFHFTAKFDYDSSYDSTSSLNSTAEFEAAAMAVMELPPSVWDVQMGEEGEAVRVDVPSSAHELDASAAEADASTAGLEFSAGVHLIDEMENQVKQWEEHEAMRESAYHSWVSQQIANTAATHPTTLNATSSAGSRFVTSSDQMQPIRIF